MVTGGFCGEGSGIGEGFGGSRLGAAGGDSVAFRGFGVSESLRVELVAGIAERGGADSGVADGGGAVLQLQVVGGRGWGLRGGCEREE